MIDLVNSDQLLLDFEELRALPWQGLSARVLTRSHKALFLRREPQKDDRFFVDPDQLSLFPAAKKRRMSVSAPSLLSLPKIGG